MISWTSPRASGYGFPISRVTSRASASLLSSTARPMFAIARPRTGAGTSAHARWASAAARAAVTSSGPSPSATSATTSSRRAGLVERNVPPGPPATGRPAMTEVTVRAFERSG